MFATFIKSSYFLCGTLYIIDASVYDSFEMKVGYCSRSQVKSILAPITRIAKFWEFSMLEILHGNLRELTGINWYFKKIKGWGNIYRW